jgi:hypothetical protein
MLILPVVFSDSINHSIIRDSQSLTNITINETRYYDQLIAEDTGGIYIAGWRHSGTEKTTFNITAQNLSLFENQTYSDLPYILATSTATDKYVRQNVSDGWDITINVSSACSGSGTVKGYACDGCTVARWGCEGTTAIIELTGVNRGNTRVYVSETHISSAQVYGYCGQMVENLSKAAVWFGIIIIAFFAFMVLAVFNSGDFPDTTSIAVFLMGLGTAAIILIIYLIIISQMC